MRVGILASRLMGTKFGKIFARAIFSYVRSKDKLKRLAREAQTNVRPGMEVS